MKKNSFYMVLPSNSCPNTQPNNVAGKYIVDIGSRIDLEDDWEVALTEFSFTFMASMIEKGKDIIYYYKEGASTLYEYEIEISNGVYTHVMKGEDASRIHEISDGVHGMKRADRDYGLITISTTAGKIKISNKKQYEMEISFETVEDAKLLGFAQNKLKGKEVISVNPFVQNTTKKIRINIKVNYEKELSRRIHLDESIVVESNEKVASELMLQFSPIFSEVIISKNVLSCITNKNVTKVVFEPTFAKLLGFDKAEFDTRTDKKIVATRNVKPALGQNHMYIYMSIIEPILVGDTYTPLLKSVWLEHAKYGYGDVVNITPKYPMYLPISSSSINNIEVNIRSDAGNIIDFGFGAKSVLTLHFRKK